MIDRPLRAMWLLNHTTARQFEIPMLKRVGVQEIFLPKSIPPDPAFRSASIDWSEDAHLTIPEEDLAILNAADWYDDPGREAWLIASKHFDIVFFIVIKTAFFKSITRHFEGAKIWRAYGLPGSSSYGDLLTWGSRSEGLVWSRDRNTWFGQAYAHLADSEPHYLQKRAIFLPAGMPDAEINDTWRGSDKRIFFICPDLAFSKYYQNVYRDFQRTFAELPYVVGGAQPVAVQDQRVLGYQPKESHQRNMQELRVMYYHSTESNHVHYHPFEAVSSGMPLVFMAGGLLDKLGGIGLPGRCTTLKEARSKIERILNDDSRLIDDIRRTQRRLLEPLKAEHCQLAWQTGLQKIRRRLRVDDAPTPEVRSKKRRIAVIVPVKYRGGSLRGAKLLARAIADGSRNDGQDVEVVFGHLDDPKCYPREEFADLPASIKRRPFQWRVMSYEEASRANAYAGGEMPLENRIYQTPDDGINQFTDCDLWIIVSDRIELPLLPVRPYLLMVYDYLQRYQAFLDEYSNQNFISRAHAAEAIFVTTEFTRGDARQFAGIPDRRIRKLPMLAPDFSGARGRPRRHEDTGYFLWTTNLAAHKNQETALKGLRLYYEEYDGDLECRVTGVDTDEMLKRDLPHLEAVRQMLRSSKQLKHKFKLEGELADRSYRRLLSGAAFLWHPGRIDNGTFSVVEAAHLGVPALSSSYPAMHEINLQFGLNLTWMDPDDPEDMARQLKQMETDGEILRERLPSAEQLASQSVEKLSTSYWNAIKDYL
jgi:glycosyltransferase involved in cell wall biosynthesis